MAIPLKFMHLCVESYMSAAEKHLKADDNNVDAQGGRNAMIVAYTLYGEDNPGTEITYTLAYDNFHANIDNVDPE
jgi:hypothetical protein